MRTQSASTKINDLKSLKSKKPETQEKGKRSKSKRIKTRPSFTLEEGKKIKNLTKEIIKGFQANKEISKNLKLKESIFYQNKSSNERNKFYLAKGFPDENAKNLRQKMASGNEDDNQDLEKSGEFDLPEVKEKGWDDGSKKEENYRKRSKKEEKRCKKKAAYINEKLKGKGYIEDKYDGYNKEGLRKKSGREAPLDSSEEESKELEEPEECTRFPTVSFF